MAPKFNAAFRRWFGNSKVVDKAGQPLVVYHGTRAPEFTEFDTGGEHGNLSDVGAHFGTIEQANSRLGFSKEVLRDIAKYGMQPHQAGARVVPVYLSLQNPITLPDIDEWNNPDQWLVRLSKIPADVRDDIRVGAQNARERFDNGEDLGFADDAKEILRYHGYDGIKYLNRFENKKKPAWSWVAFEPEQIKSIFNAGTWSPTDPDIRRNPGAYFDSWMAP